MLISPHRLPASAAPQAQRRAGADAMSLGMLWDAMLMIDPDGHQSHASAA
jgi:hypothetical protein